MALILILTQIMLDRVTNRNRTTKRVNNNRSIDKINPYMNVEDEEYNLIYKLYKKNSKYNVRALFNTHTQTYTLYDYYYNIFCIHIEKRKGGKTKMLRERESSLVIPTFSSSSSSSSSSEGA